MNEQAPQGFLWWWRLCGREVPWRALDPIARIRLDLAQALAEAAPQ